MPHMTQDCVDILENITPRMT